jgi:hypothetical protein
MGISPGLQAVAVTGRLSAGLNAWQLTKFGPGVSEQNPSTVADPTFNLDAGCQIPIVLWNTTAGR